MFVTTDHYRSFVRYPSDVLRERGPSDLGIVWRHAARSAVESGADYQALVAVLKAAADAGLLSFELS